VRAGGRPRPTVVESHRILDHTWHHAYSLRAVWAPISRWVSTVTRRIAAAVRGPHPAAVRRSESAAAHSEAHPATAADEVPPSRNGSIIIRPGLPIELPIEPIPP